MRAFSTYLLILILTLSGCRDNIPTTVYSNPKSQGFTFEKVSFGMLVKNPDKYHRKNIELTGSYLTGFEKSALYPGNYFNESQRAIWIMFHPDLPLMNTKTGINLFDSYKEIEKISGRRIRVKGKFDMDSHGHLGAYFGELYYVVSIEVLN